jgi:hypothetical protein
LTGASVTHSTSIGMLMYQWPRASWLKLPAPIWMPGDVPQVHRLVADAAERNCRSVEADVRGIERYPAESLAANATKLSFAEPGE